MTIEEKENYLLLSTYSAKDIMALTKTSRSNASIIMNECKNFFDGAVKYRDTVITARSFWQREGTTIEEQFRLLGIAKGYIPYEK